MDEDNQTTQVISITLDHVTQICRKIRAAVWKDQDLRVDVFKEGTTNTLACCYPSKLKSPVHFEFLTPQELWDLMKADEENQLPSDHVPYQNGGQNDGLLPLIVKVYGKDTCKFINRESEIYYVEQLSKLGLASYIVEKFSNGIVYEYFPGVTLTNDELGVDRISNAIIKQLVVLHESAIEPFGGNKTPILFTQIKNYINMIQDATADPIDNEDREFKRKTIITKVNGVRSILPEIEQYVKKNCSCMDDVVMCHNDLLDKNIILRRKTMEVRFIDFEYSGFNHASYDIANHMNEFAGMMEGADFTKIPKKRFILDWTERYLRNRYGNNRMDPKLLALFVDDIEMFMPISHLFWSLWSFLQSIISAKPFEYYQYGIDRFQIFWDGRYRFLKR